MSKQTSISGIPVMMRAIRLHAPIGPQGLVLEQVETPRPAAGEVLVRVYGAAITRDELDWPVNRLPAIPSYEFSGVVAALAPDVEGVEMGEAVYALSSFDRDGAAAEYVAVPGKFVASKPRTVSHVESAAIPLAALSAWQALSDHGHLAAGQRVLIQGAAGGVGGFAVQLARHYGAHVIGTVSSGHVEAARRLGANEVIDHTTDRFEEVIGQVDLVFDTAGGDRLARSLSVIRPGGRLVSIAAEPPRELAVLREVTAAYFVVTPDRKQLIEIAQLVDHGVLRPTLDRVFPLGDAREAFERSLVGHHAGKIVIRVADH